MTNKCFPYVRFSSTRQEDGSTRERQNALIDAFVSKHGLEVDRALEDAGTSAFRGLNASADGVLGGFLNQVRKGEVDKGSYLLIENFDRLSRDKIVRSNKIFTDILSAGIRIVILDRDKIFDIEHLDIGDWITALIEFERANKESERKSDFSSKAWNINRNKMRSGEIVTKKVPKWLKVEDNQFIVDIEQVNRIEQLFKLSLKYGLLEATKQYNKLYVDKLAPHQVQYILGNRKLIGEHQPKKLHWEVGGKRRLKDEGMAIPNYYPQVIEPTLFYKVQEIINDRKPFTGNYNKQQYNIFRGLIYCRWCGGTIRYMNKGERDYFICTNSMGHKCVLQGQQSIRGKKLFSLFFQFTYKLNIQSLIEENKDYSKIKTDLLSIDNQRKKLKSSIDGFKDRLINMIVENQSIPKSMNEVLTELESNLIALDIKHKAIEKQYEEATKSYNALLEVEHIDIQSIIYDRTDEAIEKRVAYNLTLKSIFKGIAIDYLNGRLELEFKDGTVRYLKEGQRTPLDIPDDFDEVLDIE
ncbi:recombinase family protein [Stutzerimonas kunmingensis]|uniref:recombinase family protein n=1 Tax=Stutzerimonas kunmingensis TaxID=1211807 RepID=UPI0037D64573